MAHSDRAMAGIVRAVATVVLLPWLLSCATEPGPTGPSAEFTLTGAWGTSHFSSDIASWYPDRQDGAVPGPACHVWIGFIAPGRAGGFDNPAIGLSAQLLHFDDCPPRGEQSLRIGTDDWGSLGGSVVFAQGTVRIDSGSVVFAVVGSFLVGTVDVWTRSDSVTPLMRMEGRFVAAMLQPCPAC